MLTAVSAPMLTSVPYRSLSMGDAPPTTAKPPRAGAAEPVCEPLPPITTSASTPRAARLARARARPWASLNSGLRALQRTVPPCWMMPPTSRAARRSMAPDTSPAKPLRTPNTSQPLASAPRVTARTAAFIPGASPPLVRTAIFFKPDILKLGRPEHGRAAHSARIAEFRRPDRRLHDRRVHVARQELRHARVEPLLARDAAAHDDDFRVEEVDHEGKGAREAVGVDR